MTIDEMFNELENKVRDTYIVTLKYKYDFEKNYTIENHILVYDSMVDRYDWLDDWYEGQTDTYTTLMIIIIALTAEQRWRWMNDRCLLKDTRKVKQIPHMSDEEYQKKIDRAIKSLMEETE